MCEISGFSFKGCWATFYIQSHLMSEITKRRSYATLSIVMFDKTFEFGIGSDWNVKQEKFPYQPK